MYLKIKRIFDILFSIIVIILLLPLYLIIGIYLKISNRGKIIFKQKRTGKMNKEFLIYKFSTSNNNKILRKYGLDELPQLINILKGDMSFVGPRPWIIEYSKFFNKKQLKRLNIYPGLTGYAQINSSTNIFEKIDKDIYYVDNVNIVLDIKILFKTIIMIFSNKKIDYNEEEIKKEICDLKNQK